MKVVLVGSMNCMLTEYAIILKKYYSEVIHYYDGGINDSLSNPNIRWGEKSREITKGLILKKLQFSNYLSYVFPRIFHYQLISQLNSADLVILSGPNISFARLVKGSEKKIVAMSYGNDISIYCNPEFPTMNSRKVTGVRSLAKMIMRLLRTKFLEYQVSGLRSCTHYSYFVAGMDLKTDALLDHLFTGFISPIRLPRYSINPMTLDRDCFIRKFSVPKDVYKILFPVRFCEDELAGNKGWRLLFDGLIKYKSISIKKFICICFKKGEYIKAQSYADEIGIHENIEWHDVVSFDVLQQYYHDSDVVIEQLGSHWIAQGLFVMALGKPLIARVSLDQQKEFFEGSGLLSVNDADSFANQLVNCESEKYRDDVGNKSRAFTLANASIEAELLKWDILPRDLI